MPLALAHKLIREKRAVGRGGNNKRKFQTLVRLDKFVDMRIPGGTLSTTYREDLGNTRSVVTLKRLTKEGEFVKYDSELTFKELSAGRFVSAATKRRRAAEREQQRFKKKN